MKNLFALVVAAVTLLAPAVSAAFTREAENAAKIFISAIKSDIDGKHGGSDVAYNAVSERLGLCGVIYGILTHNQAASPSDANLFRMNSELFLLTSSQITRLSPKEYQMMADGLMGKASTLRSNEARMRALLQNCKAFSLDYQLSAAIDGVLGSR